MPRQTIRTKHKIVAEVEANLIKQMRRGDGLSRVEVSRALNLAPSTASIYVDRLKKEGFLIEGEKIDRRFGRRPTLLKPNPDAGRFVGVDFEAQNLMTTVVDFSMQVIDRVHRKISSKATVDQVLAKMVDSIASVSIPKSSPLLGIGVGVPGVINFEKGLASEYPFVPGWQNVPIVNHLAQHFKVPVSLENNIRSMAMAELWLGKGIGLKNFICLGVRTGIGIGIVINGELFRGSHGGAGEIGNWPAYTSANCNTCANSLESTVSLPSILERASKAFGKPLDLSGLREVVATGHTKVSQVLHEAALAHAMTLRQLHLLFDPDRIIIVGPLAELGEVFLDQVKSAMEQEDGYAVAQIEIANSDFGGFGGALGAAATALHSWKPDR